jgi:putative transcriptional regulator
MISEKNGYPESLKGCFLISESRMADPHFFQSVVLIIEHTEDGAFGLVVNHRSALRLSDVLPRADSLRAQNTPLYAGGPVQQDFLLVVHSHTWQDQLSPTASEIIPGIFFEPSFRAVEDFFDDNKWNTIPEDDQPKIHLFLGYSGWSPGQLESELQSGSWMIIPASEALVFHPEPDSGWRDALKEKGGIYKIFAESNQDPRLN